MMLASVDETPLAARVARLEDRLAELERAAARRTLKAGDVAALARILPAIGGACGSTWTTIAELQLQANQAPGVKMVLAGWSSKRLGGLFRRAVGVPVDGYTIEQGDREHGARCWRIVGLAGEFRESVTPLSSFNAGDPV